MRRINNYLTLWSSTIIFVLVSSEVPGNCTSNDAATSSAQHEPRASKLIKERRTIGTSLLENLPRDVNETNEFSFNITKESHENGNLTEYQFRDDVAGSYRDYNNYMPDIAADNFAETKSSNYTALHERHEDPLNKSSKINAKCDSNICIPLCCPLGNRLIEERCVTGEGNYSFPIVHGTNATSNSSRADEIVVDKRLDEMFQLIVDDPCQKAGRFLLNESNNLADDEYWFLDNGSLYQPRRQKFIHPKSYCLALVDQDRYDVTVCKQKKSAYPLVLTVGVVISIPFLLATVVVYTILPELQNMHGYTLRAHVSSLFIAYIILAIYQRVPLSQLGYNACLVLAFLFTFSFSASFCWLNIMCIDIWWIFRKPCSSQENRKHQEKKKFVLYALYGWGCPLILNIVCAMIEFVLTVPENIVRPQFCVGNRNWFNDRVARTYYFYIPVGITIICNIILFISTALTIARHKKATDQQLRNSRNRYYDDKKQWLKMYFKLFSLMGITWIMEIIAVHAWVFNNPPRFIWYPTDMINALQGVIIFIIFVWKKRIRVLLLKRLNCQKSFLYRNSTSTDVQTSTTSH